MNMDVTLAATDLAAHDHLVGIAPFAIGIVLVAALIGAVWLGIRIRNREVPPDPDSQPHLPKEGPTDEIMENREPDEMPRDGERRLPHVGVHDQGDRESHPGEPPHRKTWEPGKSGSFGSGGFG
ncbi:MULTISPECIES: DUF6479 family protein [unclassified Streptomyces]|uniref:DUF6479 family protein n=1 Tax=unclassified Streptomyces TaxID=2593676 RepID=UPI002DD84EFB|nr:MULTISPECIES: DUF6479 family protein [unclassified Streptomyces]WSA95827.1 DUF6479 family protein [Streptomyces sp. NBC_01795]WSB80246.1 DUF6479 family protein [Streptomyces sp. NBC_01775]WSS11546.1 DUF6479 family protein [Streptomyces sp. NBC_01186]WSS40261.1 DUF6479 family protein [Streptomyces sp. NBC_01187]